MLMLDDYQRVITSAINLIKDHYRNDKPKGKDKYLLNRYEKDLNDINYLKKNKLFSFYS
jgi:hypothetical protein